MKVKGDYRRNGYAHVESLIPAEVAAALLRRIKIDLEAEGALIRFASTAITKRVAYDVYVADYGADGAVPLGLTPAMEALTGAALLPTYTYFRLYKQNDICRVHSDRSACEHSLSLTLGYSDGKVWPLTWVSTRSNAAGGSTTIPRCRARDHRHATRRRRALSRGRAPARPHDAQPNRWSAHMFLHWVDRDGPHKAHAFDARSDAGVAVDFELLASADA